MEGTDTPRSNSAREAPHRHPWAAGPRDPAKLPANVPKPKRGKPLRPRHLSHIGIGYTGQAANAPAGSPPPRWPSASGFRMAKIRAILPSSTTRLMSDGPPASSSIRMPRPPLSQSRAIFGLSAASGKDSRRSVTFFAPYTGTLTAWATPPSQPKDTPNGVTTS